MATTVDRVMQNTQPSVNERIRHATRERMDYYAEHVEEIDDRLRQLDEEWDIERTLEANAAVLALTGTVFGVLGRRTWLLLPMAVSGFLLQHAVQGWCPPVTIFRRMGVRTPREIEWERNGLKALRGDYEGIPQFGSGSAEVAFEAAVNGV